MKILLKSDCDQTIKNLLIINNFSPKLILILQKEGLNTLDIIKKNEELILDLNEKRKEMPLEDIQLDIVYEDEYFIIINKPKNISSIPSIKHYDHNLSNILMNYYTKNNVNSLIHPVTRLDYKTSGLILFAKHRYIHNLFKNIKIDKYYRATLKGKIYPYSGYFLLPIKDNDNMIRDISEDGKKSLTYYELINYEDNNSIVKIKLFTGRTHQIRRHFSYLGYPIIGDDLYSNCSGDLMLECYKLAFIHPITKQNIEVKI